YSFNDFKYISYVEGKDKALKKLFAGLRTEKEIAILNKRVQKDTVNIENVYKDYLRGINGADQSNL
ncbi:hypothetical protein AYO14_14035, partial [Listeria monocytogenes]|nr:hypothetical protein [Listeria monocytogenes]